jgi:hypothetical protein
MGIRVDILTPIGSDGPAFNPTQMLSSISSGITYKIQGYSAVIAQIDAPIDAAAAGTITLQCSQDGCSWYNLPGAGTPIEYTATGVQLAVNVEGLIFIRYQVTTTSGTVEYMLTVTGVANV